MPNNIGRISLSLVAGIISVLTVAGNLLVIVAFKYNKQLQTLSNYYLISLAVSDLATGALSMPMFILYVFYGFWPLGPIVCDIWLSVDYVMHTASVANLLIISIDRFLSVARPIRYRATRTPRKVGLMISYSWIIAVLLWPPWIFAWPHIEGTRTVPNDDCYVQFLKSNKVMNLITSLITFYIPVAITTTVYCFIYRLTAKQKKLMSKAKVIHKSNSRTVERNASVNKATNDICIENSTFLALSKIKVSNKGGTQLELPASGKVKRRQNNRLSKHLSLENISRIREALNPHKENVRQDIYLNSTSAFHLAELGTSHSQSSALVNETFHSMSEDERDKYKFNSLCLKIGKSVTCENNSITSKQDESFNNNKRKKKFQNEWTVKTHSLPDLNSFNSEIIHLSAVDKYLNNSLHQSNSTLKRIRTRNSVEPVKTETTLINKGHQSANICTGSSTLKDRTLLRPTNVSNKQILGAGKQDGRQEKKIVKVLSAILLALIITFAPYYTIVVVEVYCNGCVSTILYGVGKLPFSFSRATSNKASMLKKSYNHETQIIPRHR